ncbi:hypothetical protein QOZ80_3BG0291940 [Eleusine coracana subsp. coracana]|nr:hypothetical protein QOZ80_3BG0291940 [Eleusine coracana subsp. coracana]
MVMTSTCAGERRCIDKVSDMDLYCMNSLMHPDNPKVLPSKRCCDAVQQIDIPCLCSRVDEHYEQGVSMEKLEYVMLVCNKPLKPGSKCGIYTVPPIRMGQQEEDC